jgi:hypothetical protein
MSFLIVRCPTTQFPIRTNIKGDIDSLALTWTGTVRVPLPSLQKQARIQGARCRVRERMGNGRRLQGDSARRLSDPFKGEEARSCALSEMRHTKVLSISV